MQGKQIAANSIPPVKVEGDVPTIVWQPGGVDFGNTYSTFAGAYAAAAAVRVQRPKIIIDTTLGGALITGGPYNLDNFTLSAGPIPGGATQLTFGGGATITSTVGFELDGLNVYYGGIGPVLTISTGSATVVLSNGTTLSGSGSHPFIHVAGAGSVTIFGGFFNGGTGVPCVSADAGTFVYIYFNGPPSSGMFQNSLFGTGAFYVYVNDIRATVQRTQTGAPNVYYQALPVGGDLTWVGDQNQTVSAIQGITTPAALGAAINKMMVVGEIPPWAAPVDVAFDGVNQLYVADSAPVAGFVNLWEVDQTVTPYAYYGYTLPPTVTGISRVVHANVGGNDYICCACHSTGTDKLYIFDATNQNFSGVADFPVNAGQPTGVAVDSAGNVYTVDAVNGLLKFPTAVLTSLPSSVPASANVPVAGLGTAFDITYDGTFLYVSGGSNFHIYQYTTAFALNATYTDGSGRAMDSLFWAPGIPGVASIFVSTNVSGEVLRIATAGMTLSAVIVTVAAGLVGRMAFDGTYLYVSDPTTAYVEVINPATNAWVAHYASLIPGAAHMGGSCFSNYLTPKVWVATLTTPTGNQGISSFHALTGAIDYLTGPFGLEYQEVPPTHYLYLLPAPAPGAFISGWAVYDFSSDNSIRFRFNDGEEPVKIRSNPAHPTLGGLSTIALYLLTANPTLALNPPVQIAFDATSGAATFMTVYNGSTYVGNFLTWNSLPQFVINGDFGHSVWIFGKANNVSLLLDTNATIQNGGITLKTTTSGVDLTGGYLDILTPIATPAAPATGFRLYVDASDGRLKARGAAGTITPLANP